MLVHNLPQAEKVNNVLIVGTEFAMLLIALLHTTNSNKLLTLGLSSLLKRKLTLAVDLHHGG